MMMIYFVLQAESSPRFLASSYRTGASNGMSKRARSDADFAALPSPYELNAMLVSARGAEELARLTLLYGDNFSLVNVATALQRLARAAHSRPDAATLAVLSKATARLLTGREIPNSRTLCSIAYGLGQLGLASGDTWDAVEVCVGRVLAIADTALISTLLWLQGVVRRCFSDAALVSHLCARAAATAHLMSGAELAAAAGGAARAGITSPALWAALGKRTELLASKGGLTSQGVAALSAAWARARIAQPTSSIWVSLSSAALATLTGGNATKAVDVADYFWAFTRAHGGALPKGPLREALLAEIDRIAATLEPAVAASLLHTLTAVGSVSGPDSPLPPASTLSRLVGRTLTCVAVLGSADLGFVAASIAARSAVPSGDRRASTAAAIALRAETIAPALTWRGVAAVDLALRELSGPGVGDTLAGISLPFASAVHALSERGLAAVHELAVLSDADAAAPSALLCSLSPPPWTLHARVLLVGDDHAASISASLNASHCTVFHWRRFASDDGAVGAPAALEWPVDVDHGSQDMVIIRFPQSIEAFSLALAAATPRVSAGGRLVVYGDTREGLSVNAVRTASESWENVAEAASNACGAMIVCGRRTRDKLEIEPHIDSDSIRNHARTTSIVFPALPGALEWTTYPGLFAGGGLDVMTAALLGVLPSPPSRARVCDFACGSGTIAAYLLSREPSLRVDALDADAVALAAARVNVPAARVRPPTNGWPLRVKRYHLIVSNPPVHKSRPDDLRVLMGLLAGAEMRLKRRGALYVICQAHVCFGPLAESARLEVTAIRVASGRFIVWQCTRKYSVVQS